MITATDYLWFETKKRQEIIDITDAVDRCRAAAGIQEGMVLASAMHISASVFVNDHEKRARNTVVQPRSSICSPSGPLKTTRRQPFSRGSRAAVS